jgi:hypothetical protein
MRVQTDIGCAVMRRDIGGAVMRRCRRKGQTSLVIVQGTTPEKRTCEKAREMSQHCNNSRL